MMKACLIAATSLLMFVVFTGGYDVSAQGSGTSEEAAGTSRAETRRRRPLPAYYGKIGVTDEQREQLHAIQDRYHQQIDALQQQIRQLIRERDAEMEKLLTPGQKLRLQELRQEARERSRTRQSVRSSPDEPAPADDSTDS